MMFLYESGLLFTRLNQSGVGGVHVLQVNSVAHRFEVAHGYAARHPATAHRKGQDASAVAGWSTRGTPARMAACSASPQLRSGLPGVGNHCLPLLPVEIQFCLNGIEPDPPCRHIGFDVIRQHLRELREDSFVGV